MGIGLESLDKGLDEIQILHKIMDKILDKIMNKFGWELGQDDKILDMILYKILNKFR